jgi:hypothetical protein
VQDAVGIEHRFAVLADALGQQVAPVRGRDQQRVRGPRLESAVELGLEQLPARVALLERQVVAHDAEALAARAQERPERGQLEQIVATHLDERKPAPNSPASPRTADDLPVPRSP